MPKLAEPQAAALAGRRLSARLPQFDAGRGPRQGIRYPRAPIEESIAVEGWRCSSVGSAPEVAISIAPALSLESRVAGRQVGGFAIMPIVGA